MSAGHMLRSAREASGLSLDDLAHATKLRASVLGAMEQDDFTHCGGVVYARGQLRSIATVLGLDPDDLVDAFEEGLGVEPLD